MSIRKINDNLYDLDIYVGYGVSYKKFNNIIKKKWRVINDVECPPRANGLSLELNTGWLIWVEQEDIGILAHESLHITQAILEHRGIYLNSGTREVYAYYLGWLINKILNKKEAGK